jgi:RHS repeat-associated protein
MSSKVDLKENTALAKALLAFKSKTDLEDVSDLTNFIQTFPNSRWNASLKLNLGQRRFETGYLSDALSNWKDAWEESRNAIQPHQKAVADGAISQLLILEARLGRTDDVETRLSEVARRGFFGSSEQRVRVAKEGLRAMRHDPNTSFKCGPYAINTILNLGSTTPTMNPILKMAASTSRGTNLQQLKELSDDVGLHYQTAKRSDGASFIVPSIVHFTVGHFAAITAFKNGKYQLKDPTFGTASMSWLSPAALEKETDGFFLIPPGPLPPGWQPITRAEAESVWGKGDAQGCDDPAKTPCAPTECPKKKCPLAQASVFTMQATPTIFDTPISYEPPIGPAMDFTVNFNYMETDQPGTFTFTNLSPNWSFNWTSYLTLDASQNASVRVRGGGVEIYRYELPDNVNNPYPPNTLSHAILTALSDGTYQRQLPDGSTELFNKPDGTGRIFMTSVSDPQGNSATITYDANFRVTSITDAIGQQTTLAYASTNVANPGYYQIASISGPSTFSPQPVASFVYDSTNSYLVSITDVIGLKSEFNCDAGTSFISALTTPYGTTSFTQYTPFGNQLARGLKMQFPDGSSQVLENWQGEYKLTYFWDREATMLYPMDPGKRDYSHCKMTKFLWDPNGSIESPVISFVKRPLESMVSYVNDGETHRDFVGGSNLPIQVSQVLAGNQTYYATLFGTVTPGDQLGINVYDSGLPGGSIAIVHTVQLSDNFQAIAFALTNAINGNAALQTLGVTATANATSKNISYITLNSTSSNLTSYTHTTNIDATEYVALTANANGPATITLGGSAFAGDHIYLTAFDPGLLGGSKMIDYIVLSGQTVPDIATKFAEQISLELSEIGLTATAIGTVISLTNTDVESNATTFKLDTSADATETAVLSTNTQTSNYSYNSLGHTTKSVDPIGRTTSHSFAANNVDLLETRETQGTNNALIGKWIYNNAQHVPNTFVDGSGQKTQYLYNANGQMLAMVDPLGNSRTNRYSTTPMTVGGTVTTGNTIALKITDASLGGGGFVTLFYVVPAGSTLASIAAGIATAINGNSSLQNIGVKASSTAGSATFTVTSNSTALTSYAVSYTGTGTEILGIGVMNNLCYVTVGGTMTGGDMVTVTVKDPSFGQVQCTYTVPSSGSPTASTVAAGIAASINTNLSANNITATSLGTIVSIKTQTNGNVTSFAVQGGGGATETFLVGCTFGYLTQMKGPLVGDSDTTRFVYDSYGRTAKSIDSEGYVVTYGYDQANRPTVTAFPDGSNEEIGYLNLEPVSFKDRLGRTSQSSYDNMQQLSADFDPLGRKTKYAWCICGAISSLTDPSGNTTSWQRDLQGRVTSKVYADSSAITYVYENNTSRLKSITDARNQTITFSYNLDDSLQKKDYSVTATSDVQYTYDPNYQRLLTASNGWGTIAYAYNAYITDPFGTPTTGGGKIQSISNDVIPNSAIAFSYDALGRTTQRTINGSSNQVDWSYDAMSRVLTEKDGPLSSTPFAFAYVDDTAGTSKGTTRLASISYPNSQVTTFDWYNNVGDQRLQQITNKNPSAAILSQFYYCYDAESQIIQWQKLQNANKLCMSFDYDRAGQLLSAETGYGDPQPVFANQHHYAYDRAANRASVQTSSSQAVKFTGTVTASDQLQITVSDPGLGSSVQIQYTVQGTDTLATVASEFALAITTNASLRVFGISATSNGDTLYIKSTSPNITTYSNTSSGTPTENMTFAVANGTEFAIIGGSNANAGTLTITVHDPALPGGTPEPVTYAVSAGQSLTAVASGLAAAINANTNLINIGVSASAISTSIRIKSNTVNHTIYTWSAGSGALETITLREGRNPATTIVLSGPIPGVNLRYSIGIFDPAGGASVTYDNGASLSAIATQLVNLINNNASNQALGVSASASGPTITIYSGSPNVTLITSSVSQFGAPIMPPVPQFPEMAQSVVPNGTVPITIGGTATTQNDQVSITIFDSALTGGSVTKSHTVGVSDSFNNIALQLRNAINGDTNLASIGVTASMYPVATSTVVNINSTSINATTYSGAVTGPGTITETVTIPPSFNVMRSAHNSLNQVTGSSSGGAAYFMARAGKVLSTATVSSTVIGIESSSTATTYSVSKSTGATESITAGTNFNGSVNVTIGGTAVTPTDVLTITVNDSRIPSTGSESVDYIVQAGDTYETIAARLAAAISANPKLQNIAVASTNTMVFDGTRIMKANPVLAAGANSPAIISNDFGTTLASSSKFSVTGGNSSTYQYDENGNLHDDGTNIYDWDAEDRLVQITYPGSGNNTQLAYDPLGRCVAIVENGTSPPVSGNATKQFVWCGNERCEERDNTGAVVKQFFDFGQTIGGSAFYYFTDHLWSVRELTNSSGAVHSEYAYDPYGRATKISGTGDSDLQYAGYYMHSRSALHLLTYRAYSANLGRFINRDPSEDDDNPMSNLYVYADNDPIDLIDADGYAPMIPPAGPAPNSGRRQHDDWTDPRPVRKKDTKLRPRKKDCEDVKDPRRGGYPKNDKGKKRKSSNRPDPESEPDLTRIVREAEARGRRVGSNDIQIMRGMIKGGDPAGIQQARQWARARYR